MISSACDQTLKWEFWDKIAEVGESEKISEK